MKVDAGDVIPEWLMPSVRPERMRMVQSGFAKENMLEA